ncbi:MAG: biotin transporter BioY [Xenococcaceae cyanobacterium]
MSNRHQLSKPDADITNYEWEVTPPSVKIVLQQLEQFLQQKQQTLERVKAENNWLREQLDLRIDRQAKVPKPQLPEVILWATIGLIITIGGTFIPAYTLALPWHWGEQGMHIETLRVSYQIGAVLLIGCVGGSGAALLSQLAYVVLGLTGVPIFDRGGGWEYILEPNFGYLVGFIIGAWVCGILAFTSKVKLSLLAVSSLIGLFTIHLIGVVYLTVLTYVPGLNNQLNSLGQSIITYSFNPLGGQLAVVCAGCLIAYVVRKMMFS